MMDIKDIHKIFPRKKAECIPSAAFCIAALASYFQKNILFERVLEEVSNTQKEQKKISLLDIQMVLNTIGLLAEGFQAETVSELSEIDNPAVIPIFSDSNESDFAVYFGKYENKFLIGDPSWGLNLYSIIELDAFWDNKILLEVKNG